MHRAYKFRIYPTPAQEAVLRQTIGACRFVYNWGLEEKTREWVQEKKPLPMAVASRRLTRLKGEGAGWLNDISSVCLQQALWNLDSAFVNFFKKRGRYPKFKKKRSGGSARYASTAFRMKNGKFYLAKIKTPIDVRWSREFPSEPTSVTVSLNPAGQWHASFLCEEEVQQLPLGKKKLGIDLGIETFATLSDGRKFKLPPSIKEGRVKIEKARRTLFRKTKESHNWRKAREKVARRHQNVADARKDFLHKLSTQIVRESKAVAIEDLGVAQMMKGPLARSIGEQGWREFRTMLEYKCGWHGRELRVVDRYYPSSKTCSRCGAGATLSLKDRSWVCRCGATHDRDVNAAKNIWAAGQAATVCGADGRPIGNYGSRGRSAAKQKT